MRVDRKKIKYTNKIFNPTFSYCTNAISEHILLFYLSSITLGIVIDILTQKSYLPSYPVNQSFVFSVFGAEATFAAIGSTLLSIIINASNKKILGIPINLISREKSKFIPVSSVILFCYMSVVPSIGFLALGFVNSIILIFISNLIILTLVSNQIWQVVSDYEKGKELVFKFILNKNENRTKQVILLVKELELAIEQKNTEEVDDIIELFSFMRNRKEYFEIVSSHINGVFALTVNYYGLGKAFDKILRLGIDEGPHFDERTALYSYVEGIQQHTASEFAKFKSADNIGILINSSNMEGVGLIFLLGYFRSITKNQMISNDYKHKLIDEFLEQVCNFYFIKLRNVAATSLLYIFRDYVLQNTDKKLAEYVYECLVRHLHEKNDLAVDEFYKTIALLFQAQFFYSYYEEEAISKYHQTWLKSLFDKNIPTISNETIAMRNIVLEHRNQIIEMILAESFSDNSNDFIFGYYPFYSKGNNVIWHTSNNVKFAFCLHCAIGYLTSHYTMLDIINKQLGNPDQVYQACSLIMESVDPKTITPNAIATTNIREIQGILKEDIIIPDGLFKIQITEINNYIKNANQVRLSDTPETPEIDTIYDEMLRHAKNNKFYLLNSEIDIENKRNEQQYRILEIKSAKATSLSFTLYSYLIILLNKLLFEILSCQKPPHSIQAMKSFIQALNEFHIKHSNYRYMTDLQFVKLVYEDGRYMQLINSIADINYLDIKDIHKWIFLNVPTVSYNFKIYDYQTEPITAEVAKTELAKVSVSGTLYKLDGGLYDADEATNYYCKNYTWHRFMIAYDLDVNRDNGFILE